jgi:hypothetical protein
LWLLLGGATIPLAGQATNLASQPSSTADPSHQLRLALGDVEYVGAFRLPAEAIDGDSFSFGGAPLTYNPGADSLFIGTRGGKIAEVSIPRPRNSAEIADLPSARYVQGFRDPTEGRIRDIASEGAAINGLLVFKDRLYGTGSIYYDANNTQDVSHYSRALSLATPGVRGMYRVGERGKAGFVAGYLASVPAEWQAALGGPAVTGQCCIPIVFRTSWGPALYAWDPAELGVASEVRATPLVSYPAEHPTLGPWEGSNATYGGTTQIAGAALIAGTRTALFVGRNGLGPFCYGNGTPDKRRANDRGSDGETLCYDPVNSDKGQHAFPYRYQFWAYDLNDLASVKAGTRDPWEVRPYGVWPFDLPTPEPGTRIGGVGYDAVHQLLYLSQLNADQDGYAYRPLIHVYRIS